MRRPFFSFNNIGTDLIYMVPLTTEREMSPPAVVCISHGEDADGITCAALLKRIRSAKPILVTYDDFKPALESIDSSIKELYITDLNVREDLLEEVLRINKFCSVMIIDHHPTTKEILEALEKSGIEVVHDTRDCASVLVYNRFQEEFNREAGRMAAFAAWADQFEDGPIADKLLRDYDRQFVQHEGLLLAHALPQKTDKAFRSRTLNAISKYQPPHRIPGLPEVAMDHLEKTAKLIETLSGKAKQLKVISYVQGEEGKSIGSIAGLITDAMGADVGLCFKTKNDLMNVSLRSKRGLPYHLGEITRKIASELGGFGGGHKRASGASIPREVFQDFLEKMDETLVSFTG